MLCTTWLSDGDAAPVPRPQTHMACSGECCSPYQYPSRRLVFANRAPANKHSIYGTPNESTSRGPGSELGLVLDRSTRYRDTVRSPTTCLRLKAQSLSSSPWILGVPQVGLASSRTTVGLPEGHDLLGRRGRLESERRRPGSRREERRRGGVRSLYGARRTVAAKKKAVPEGTAFPIRRPFN